MVNQTWGGRRRWSNVESLVIFSPAKLTFVARRSSATSHCDASIALTGNTTAKKAAHRRDCRAVETVESDRTTAETRGKPFERGYEPEIQCSRAQAIDETTDLRHLCEFIDNAPLAMPTLFLYRNRPSRDTSRGLSFVDIKQKERYLSQPGPLFALSVFR